MTETRIITIRHGETLTNIDGTDVGQTDSPLSPRGVAQADAIADRLSNMDFELIYSSDLGRALQTAESISVKTGKTIQIDLRLRERNMGIFEGLTDLERLDKYPKERKKYLEPGNNYQIPKGESREQRNKRVIECFEYIVQKHLGQTVVVVTHGGGTCCHFSTRVGDFLSTTTIFQTVKCWI